jgi:hypothetical protein
VSSTVSLLISDLLFACDINPEFDDEDAHAIGWILSLI